MNYNVKAFVEDQTKQPKLPFIVKQKSDKLYANDLSNPPKFKFDSRVADVFADMISRSVPGYTQILNLLPNLAAWIELRAQPNKVRAYDLGCSLGAGTFALAHGFKEPENTIVGIDNSQAMITRAEKIHSATNIDVMTNIEFKTADVLDYELQACSAVLMNFTLQFIALEQRESLLRKIYSALEPGGVLILSEKIKFRNVESNQLLTEVHHLFKSSRGYSELEISQKRDAIENVLIPETLESHTSRLNDVGFRVITPWVQNLQFISILAIK